MTKQELQERRRLLNESMFDKIHTWHHNMFERQRSFTNLTDPLRCNLDDLEQFHDKDSLRAEIASIRELQREIEAIDRQVKMM